MTEKVLTESEKKIKKLTDELKEVNGVNLETKAKLTSQKEKVRLLTTRLFCTQRFCAGCRFERKGREDCNGFRRR